MTRPRSSQASRAQRRIAAPSRARIGRVLERLGRAIRAYETPAVGKVAEEERDPFRIMIATLLSARTQDATTYAASERLFALARTPGAMGRLSIAEIERAIYPVSFFRHKARHVKAACAMLLAEFGGHVPPTMDELLRIPGVGRKTANLVLILGHQREDAICVDTHVHRIANRLGWVETRLPEQTEMALYRVVPKRWWKLVNDYLVTWGQNVCRPVMPRCRPCVIRDLCLRRGVTKISPATELPTLTE